MVDKKPQKSNAFWQNIVRKWGEYNRWIIFLLFIMVVFIVVISLYFYLTANEDYLYPSNFWERLSDPEEPLNVRNILLGLAGIVGLFLAGWRGVSMDRQAKTDERRQITESKQFKADQEKQLEEKFDNAVQSLSRELNENSYSDHTNAITTLRYIALNNTSYTQRCLDIICRCNQWMEGFLTEFSVYKKEHCYADEFLTEVNRIAKTNDELKETVSLHQERRSQAAIKAVALILDRIGADDPKKHLLAELDFSDKMLCGINLSGSEIEGVNFNRAYLNGSDLSDARLKKATFRGSSLQGARLHRANMQGAQLRRANMQGAQLRRANMQGAMLLGVDMRGAGLHRANMQRAHLLEANMQGAMLLGVDMRGAQVRRSNMRRAKLYSVDMQGAMLLGVDMRRAELYSVDMQGAHLLEANMQGAMFNNTNLQGAILLRCNLYDVNLQDSNFTNIMFDKISVTRHREEEPKQMKDVLGKADKGKDPKGLDNLQVASILKQNGEEKWEIDDSKIGGLKEFYRTLIKYLSPELNQSKSNVLTLIFIRASSNLRLRFLYPKIYKALNKIWDELKDEALEEERVAEEKERAQVEDK